MRLRKLFDKAVAEITSRLPLTYMDIVWRLLDKSALSILDVGCGFGEPMKFISKRKRFYSVGLDISKTCVEECKSERIFNNYVLSDASYLPFRNESFDVVFCSQVMEHLDKTAGLKMLDEIETIAAKQVIVGTPTGFIPFLPLNFHKGNNNIFQVHLSGWSPSEFARRGYKIRYQGLRLVYGEKGLMRGLPRPLRPILSLISYITSPLTYFFPSLSIYMIASKLTDASHNKQHVYSNG